MKQPGGHGGLRGVLVNTGKLLGVMAVTVLVSEVLRMATPMQEENIIIVYLLGVVVISRVTPAYVYGIVAAVLNTLAYDFFITTPRFALSFTFSPGSPVTLITMLVVTVLTSALTIQMQSQTNLAVERERKAEMLYEINERLMTARDVKTIVNLVVEYLESHLHCPVIVYMSDPKKAAEGECCYVTGGGAPACFLTDAERRRVHLLYKTGADEAARPQDDDAEQDIYYVPLVAKDRVLGVVGIAKGETALSPAAKAFVMMLTGQVALALELQYVSSEQYRVSMENEREKMRSTLLRAISHDLRTPLTSILGASSTLLEQQAVSDPTHVGLVKGIRDDTQWLIRMVENLLVITRISGDNVKVNKTLEAAEEVVAEAVSIVRGRFPDYFIHVHATPDLLMVPMDATLISQVLINLLENAVKNSEEDSLILLDLERKGDCAQFSVSDNGKGIPEYLLENLFDVHSPLTVQAVDASRGMGIGLSICKTIIQAHGGVIEGFNRKKGGACFQFRLPLAPPECQPVEEESGDA